MNQIHEKKKNLTEICLIHQTETLKMEVTSIFVIQI